MNKHKVVWILALALTLLISALHLDSVALAQSPPSREVTWSYQKIRTINPGKTWSDRNGYHIRGRVDVGVVNAVSGNIQGSARVVYNADFPVSFVDAPLPLPKSGSAYGSIVISPTDPDVGTVYTWTGSWNHTIRLGNVVSGSMQAMNREKTLRMKIDRIYQNTAGVLMHHGLIEMMYCEQPVCPTS